MLRMSFQELASGWTATPLSTGWSKLAAEQVRVLSSGAAPFPETLHAWQQLAMLYGDSRAPELCAVVALHAVITARARMPDTSNDERIEQILAVLRSHVNLALLDLGLAWSRTGGPVALIELDTQIGSDPDTVEGWLRDFLEPVGTLTDGAHACLRLVAIRAGLLERPEPFTLTQVCQLSLRRQPGPPGPIGVMSVPAR